jgi:hypothetical protein
LTAADLNVDENFKRIAENRYLVVKSCYLKGIYVYQNDQLRLEGIEENWMKDLISLPK